MKGPLGVGCDCWALGTRLRLAGMLTDRTIAQQWDTLHLSAPSEARSCQKGYWGWLYIWAVTCFFCLGARGTLGVAAASL